MSERKVGVYICHCGGNISDYVDVETVKKSVEKELGVTVAKTSMFTCSDASQQEIIKDIKENNLDGMVVASCSPKLHLNTFRGVAERAGLNPFQYVQVNIREQCSWPHSDDKASATVKATGLIKGGIEKAKLAEPLEPIRVTSVKKVLVIGAGIAGFRAAIEMSNLGVEVFLIERAQSVGGHIARLGTMYPSGEKGSEVIAELSAEVARRPNITLFAGAELAYKEGYIGNFNVTVRVSPKNVTSDKNDSETAIDAGPDSIDLGQKEGEITLNVGAIITATGFEPYQPAGGEYGYGEQGVVTLPEFERMIEHANGALDHNGRAVRSIAFIYCVGSRESKERENANLYCSRYCCNAAVHTSLVALEKFAGIRTFHLYRDMRTYGKFELLYEEASKAGSTFVRFSESEPPQVRSENGNMFVQVKDLLTAGEEIEIPVDLVVLVTGMVPAENDELTGILRLPIGSDRFYNEIHPKLRPVETVIDGVYIGGCCQGPKNASESIASSLSAVSKAASLLVKGYVDLQPFVAYVKEELCTWCGECEKACPYPAIEKISSAGKEVATVREVLCKGCGACVPVCPYDATQLKGYTDDQIMSMIDAFAEEAASG